MKWMQTVCRNFRADLRGFIAATAAVISFSAADAQEGRTIAAKISAGSNDVRDVFEEFHRPLARARHRAARGRGPPPALL